MNKTRATLFMRLFMHPSVYTWRWNVYAIFLVAYHLCDSLMFVSNARAVQQNVS